MICKAVQTPIVWFRIYSLGYILKNRWGVIKKIYYNIVLYISIQSEVDNIQYKHTHRWIVR